MALRNRHITIGIVTGVGLGLGFAYRGEIARKLGYGLAPVVTSFSTGPGSPAPIAGTPAPTPEPRNEYVDSFIADMKKQMAEFTAKADGIQDSAKTDIAAMILSRTEAYRTDAKKRTLERYQRESGE